VYSEGEGKGSMFTLELPMMREGVQQTPSAPTPTRCFEVGHRRSLLASSSAGHGGIADRSPPRSRSPSIPRCADCSLSLVAAVSHEDVALRLDDSKCKMECVSSELATAMTDGGCPEKLGIEARECDSDGKGSYSDYGNDRCKGSSSTAPKTVDVNFDDRGADAGRIIHDGRDSGTAGRNRNRNRDIHEPSGKSTKSSLGDSPRESLIPRCMEQDTVSSSSLLNVRIQAAAFEQAIRPDRRPTRAKAVRDETEGNLDQEGGAKYHILVVDDSTMNRKMLCKILKAAGHVCEEAEDGLIALEKVEQKMADTGGGRQEYDAILMDFIMPNVDGPTATKEIRQLGYKGPIFGVTGNGLESDIRYFESCGADKVLIKPFRLEEFHEQMTILSNRTARSI
jgi:CheY-like chemotaxis protein